MHHPITELGRTSLNNGGSSDPEGQGQGQNESSSSLARAKLLVPFSLVLSLVLVASAGRFGGRPRAMADLGASIMKMRRYFDPITGSDVFTDGFKFEETCDGLIYKVTGKYVELEDLEDSELQEKYVVPDFVASSRLEKSAGIVSKKDAEEAMKKYVGKLMKRLMEEAPERADFFKRHAQRCLTDLMEKDFAFYYTGGDEYDGEGIPILVIGYGANEDPSVGDPVSAFIFKDGVSEENL
eukprot:TRINITY_DN20494_c0_g1_i1.p1 TRINITY_DN20494_c0_g1~~TRINITY_DN20494_c0_g1_i1.p1  ORF type:complete len:239 (-),score=30.40 TRINITY_DN20494_c0_g1_i1:132-848(-)